MIQGHKIEDAAAALAFLLAGKATLTVVSEATGERFTYQVRNWKKAKYGTMHFVSVRTGNDYAKIGVVKDKSYFTTGQNTDLGSDDTRTLGFRYIFGNLIKNRMPPKAEIWHEGTCGRCSRPLTDPVSIASGLGPECRAKLGK